MIDINWRPSPRELRTFGLAFLVFALIAGGVLWWRLGPGPFTWGLWAAGPVVALLGWLRPPALRFLYVGLSLLAYPIGIVVGNLLLAVVYYLVITPIGLVFRLIGRDALHRKLDPEASSYWIERKPPASAARYFRQH